MFICPFVTQTDKCPLIWSQSPSGGAVFDRMIIIVFILNTKPQPLLTSFLCVGSLPLGKRKGFIHTVIEVSHLLWNRNITSRLTAFIPKNVEKFSLRPGSHLIFWVVRVVQKDPKDKDSQFESFVCWVFLHDLNDPNRPRQPSVNQALEKF